MVDEVQSIDAPVEASIPQEQVSDVQQVDAPVQAESNTQEPVAEKMIPQSQVNKIAAKEARAAYEKGQREAQARYEREMQDRMNQNQPAQQSSTVGGMQQYTQEQIQNMIREQAHKMSQEAVINKIAQDFEAKIENAKLEDPEFEEKYDALNMVAHPKTILWVNALENTTDVIKDMADNPAKYANIIMFSNSGLDHLAQKELQKLSASIKANKAAQNIKQPNAPLDHIKSSGIGMDNGNSVEDFMNMSWLRG